MIINKFNIIRNQGINKQKSINFNNFLLSILLITEKEYKNLKGQILSELFIIFNLIYRVEEIMQLHYLESVLQNIV